MGKSANGERKQNDRPWRKRIAEDKRNSIGRLAWRLSARQKRIGSERQERMKSVENKKKRLESGRQEKMKSVENEKKKLERGRQERMKSVENEKKLNARHKKKQSAERARGRRKKKPKSAADCWQNEWLKKKRRRLKLS